MAISADEVRWIAHLARIELGDAEQTALVRRLGAIVEYVNQLQKVPTEGVVPLVHALEIHNVFREDEIAPSLSVEQALANAPDRRGDFFNVPAVLD